MKIQNLKQVSFSLLMFVLLVGSGIVFRSSPRVFATSPAPIDKIEVKNAFESKKFSSIISELNKIHLDKSALDNDLIMNEVVSLYNNIDDIPLSESESIDIKRKIIEVLYKARIPLSMEALKKISLTDQDPDIRQSASDWYTNKRQLPISMQIDTSRYILVDGKGMTYEQAYPILVKKVRSSSIEQKINGIKLLRRYGHQLRNKPIIDELIGLYHVTPTVPDKPYQEYSELEEKSLALKSGVLLTMAVSGSPKAKDLLNEAKSSPNESMRTAAYKIEALLTTDALDISAQPQKARIKVDDNEHLYLILRKAVPKKEALEIIGKTLQENKGKEILTVINDIGRDPSLIKGTDIFNSLLELLIRISQTGMPDEWKLSADETIQMKDQVFANLVNSNDPRISDVLSSLKNTNDPEIKYLVKQYKIDQTNEK